MRNYGKPYALTPGPYGSVLVLTWMEGVSPPRAAVVALEKRPGIPAG